MSRLSRIALLVLTLAAGAAFANDAGLQRCRAIKESAQRLACYDALPIVAPPAASPMPGAPPAAVVPVPAPSLTQSLLSRFGFEQRPQPDELASVQSHIPGRFQGWQPMSLIKLANGQVWQISDGSSRFAWVESPRVTVTRGAIGSFFLEIEGVNPAPRVRRVQ